MTQVDPARPVAGPGPADVRLSQRAEDAAAVEAEVQHRRRLTAAWLHGSARTAADRTSVAPWVLVGLLVVALIAATLGIVHAFRAQQRINDQQNQRLNPTPTATALGRPATALAIDAADEGCGSNGPRGVRA